MALIFEHVFISIRKLSGREICLTKVKGNLVYGVMTGTHIRVYEPPRPTVSACID